HPLDEHFCQVIERSCRLHLEQGCCQRQPFVGFEIFHLGRVEGSCFSSKLLDFAFRNSCKDGGWKKFALLRDGKQVIDQQTHMGERWTRWLLFELFPSRELVARLNH